MIVIAADNGRPFPRCKSRLYDSGIKTPWVVHYPGMIKRASVSGSLVSVIDLSATCLELAGIQRPDCIQGRSFVPILKNPNQFINLVSNPEHAATLDRARSLLKRWAEDPQEDLNLSWRPGLTTRTPRWVLEKCAHPTG